jgi:hypothetical protein
MPTTVRALNRPLAFGQSPISKPSRQLANFQSRTEIPDFKLDMPKCPGTA